MSLIPIISAFLGITLIYTGFLVASANHMSAGIAASFAGFLLLVKPAMRAARHLSGQSGPLSQFPRSRTPRSKSRTKKVYLKVVKSEDDKPTIH